MLVGGASFGMGIDPFWQVKCVTLSDSRLVTVLKFWDLPPFPQQANRLLDRLLYNVSDERNRSRSGHHF